MKPKIALVTNELEAVGGLPTMITFLHRIIKDSGRYDPEIVSVATSSTDASSVRLAAPQTWFQGVQSVQMNWRGMSHTHIGAWGTELEFQRYRPRKKLTDLLNKYDLVQFVVGAPSWANVALHLKRPFVLWTATTTRPDRESRVREYPLHRKVWTNAMTAIAESYEQCALRRADKVLALSQYTFDLIRAQVETEKLFLAPCGIDVAKFTPAAESAARNYILSTARFSDPRKNVRLLLQAYAQVHRNRPDLPDLYLVGDQPSAENQALLVQLGIAEKVRMLGQKNSDELSELFRNAYLFALSSDEEGLGIVVLEAMASGLPIVCTDCGGPSTAIAQGKSGILTPVGSVDDFAQGLEKLIANPTLAFAMGQEGRRIAEERFSLAATGRVFLDRYDELLTGKRKTAETYAVNFAGQV